MLFCPGVGSAIGGTSVETVSARQITIAAGPIEKALSSFSAANNIEILADPALLSGKTTAGISGTFTPRDGLRALLVGSGLDVDWQDGSASLRASH